MIKINLLPYRAERKKELILQQLVVGVVPLVFAIAVIAFFWWSIKSDIADTENEIARLQREIKKQERTIKKIAEFKKKKVTLTKKMKIITSLQKGKSGPVHVLDDLAISLPGRLWLVSVKQTGMNLEIKGKALDNISISNYMINLDKSSYFKNVDLKKIKTDKSRGPKGVQLKNFVITCNIIYSLEQAEPTKETKNQKKKI